MNTEHSFARPNDEYQPTIIESGLLISRLVIQIEFLESELKRGWVEFKTNPAAFGKRFSRDVFQRFKRLLSTPHAVPACLTAIVAITSVVMLVILVDKSGVLRPKTDDSNESPVELVMLDVSSPPETADDSSIGKDGPGRVGFRNGKGEGSGPTPQRARGGGGSGDRDPLPAQVGKIPPPSNISAAIPRTPPVTPALPVAGVDIDPALWKDLKAPVYGDPRSHSEIPSRGPGEGGAFGSGKGTGIGEGAGPGVGPGRAGNMGNGSGQTGCCGDGGGSDNESNRTFSGPEVDQRARLLFKPEPQYTEEARRNQITGTVMLRVIFSSAGEVEQIRAVRTLPFGLTEKAIAAARQIRFVPAVKSGRPVSVHMQLEYNFNLY